MAQRKVIIKFVDSRKMRSASSGHIIIRQSDQELHNHHVNRNLKRKHSEEELIVPHEIMKSTRKGTDPSVTDFDGLGNVYTQNGEYQLISCNNDSNNNSNNASNQDAQM